MGGVVLLKRSLTPANRPHGSEPGVSFGKLWGAALVSGVLAFGVKVILPRCIRSFPGAVVLSVYGVSYFVAIIC